MWRALFVVVLRDVKEVGRCAVVRSKSVMLAGGRSRCWQRRPALGGSVFTLCLRRVFPEA
jgi:hypothetical protein